MRKRGATAEDATIGQKLRALRLERGLSKGALRLAQACASIRERTSKAALVRLAKALTPDKRA